MSRNWCTDKPDQFEKRACYHAKSTQASQLSLLTCPCFSPEDKVKRLFKKAFPSGQIFVACTRCPTKDSMV